MTVLSVLFTKESVLDMVYESHAVEFHGQEAVDFEGAESWRGPDFAYRLRTEYEDENRLVDKLDLLLQQPGADGLSSLIIGAWNGAHDGDNSAECIAALVDRAGKLSHLKALFFGDITFEEYEISWIVQSDVSPLLTAFPGLETFRVRGATELSFSPVRHENLREFAVESGGLGSSILREIFLCQFPNLEEIELHLGMPDYGFDGTVDDLQPVLTGKLHPKLKSLGLLNSEITDDIAAIVVNAPIIRQIETLDLSLGVLTDAGARSLMHLPTDAHLKRLDISHHYLSSAVLEELRNRLPFEVIALDGEDPNTEWRGPVHGE